MDSSLAAAMREAATAVAAVLGGRNLDVALARSAESPRRAAIQELAYGALRQFGRGDLILNRLLRSPLKDAQIRGLLLAALHRLELRPEDAHTTVDQAVTAAGKISGGHFKSLVNAVLRNAQRRRAEIDEACLTDPVARWRTPAWWIAAVQRAYPETWQDILAAGNGHPPMTLRTNCRRLDAQAYLTRLESADIAATLLDDHALRLAKPVPVDRLPGFAEGDVSVQDWGAQRAAILLDARPGMRVLDACAAPGGKTAHLLERANLDLLALEAEASRALRIHENLDRLGLAATVKVADARHVDTWWDGRPFDRILADVPCSASGVVRRHPDSKWLRRPEDVAGFARVQGEILDAVWRALAPGGRMLYCTCSLFPEENGQQIAAFAARHGDVCRLPTGSGEEFQLTPQADHDGFYYALLEKRA